MKFNKILDNKSREEHKGNIDSLFQACPEMMVGKIPEANVQQGFGLEAVNRLHKLGDKVLCVGSYMDTCTATLERGGMTVEKIDPQVNNLDLEKFYNLPQTKDNTYDIIFSISVLEHVQEDVRFMSLIAKLLKVGGKAIITCDFKNGWKEGDELPKEDCRLYTKEDLLNRILPAMEGCELIDEPDWDEQNPDFWYQNKHNYTFATMVVEKK